MTDSAQNSHTGEGTRRHLRDDGTPPHTEDTSLPSEDARRFAEEVAGAFHAQGFPRMAARVLMALTISPTQSLTAAQLRERLGVSPAAISAAISYTQSVDLVRVRSIPGARQQVYSLARDDWYRAVISRTAFYSSMADLCHSQLEIMESHTDHSTRQRIEDMGRFFTFLLEKFPPLLAEWDSTRHDKPAES